jgi:serine-type D-Ala-D-Ala carboxypeptidase/endopeptidase (penicillin-binding protein 4)
MFKKGLSWLLGCCWILSSHAASIQNKIDEMINKVDPNINLGMKIIDLNTQTVLYQRRPTQLFIPASNMKLFSTAAALLLFGPDYQFENQLSTHAPQLENGVLKGSVYLNLSGDPSFGRKQLKYLLNALPALGVRQIQGNFIIVSSLEQITTPAPGVVAKDFSYRYGAPIGPVIIDENQINITVNPGANIGKHAIVEYHAPENAIKLRNNVITSDKTKGCGVQFQIDENNQLTLNGCIGIHQAAIQQHVAIRNPLSYLSELIKYQLSKEHIRLDGQVILSHATPRASLVIASQKSAPLTRLMSDTLKPSNNVYANSIYLHTANKLNGSNVNWQQADPIIRNFLQKNTGIALQNAIFTDGSGLSRNNRVTPEQTLKLLTYIYTRFPLAYEYIAALPVSAQDGTLQRRFVREHSRGLIRAKTGSMTGISSLSGYIYTTNGHTLAFTLYINTLPGTKPNISGKYSSLVNQICNFLVQQRPENTVHTSLLSKFHLPFHDRLSKAALSRQQQFKWRRLEYAIKSALKNQPVTVLFRHQKLVLIDHNAQVNKVWHTLEKISTKYPFAVVLNSRVAPDVKHKPLLLWINNNTSGSQRTWIVKNVRDDK